MSCGYQIHKIEKILEKNLNRKTIPKKDVLDVIRLFSELIKHQEHLAGCYLPGQKPPTLSEQHIKENGLIREFNININHQFNKIKNLTTVKPYYKVMRLVKLW